ncbi:hypothetical protein L0Y59_02190 [Candidatus Uhrbacteria bacterium]|nr:hypothetical protein [Candidatus Uhrbacteria bacterium]
MPRDVRISVATIALWANALFWLLMAVGPALLASHPTTLLLGAVVLAESILYALCVYGLRRRVRALYVFALVLSGGTAILSVTDQFGLLDAVSFGLSLWAFIAMLLVRTRLFPDTKRST